MLFRVIEFPIRVRVPFLNLNKKRCKIYCSGLTKASMLILVIIILAIGGIVAYGGYHYVSDHPSVLNFLRGGTVTTHSTESQSPPNQTQNGVSLTLPTESSSITFATEVNVTTQGSSTVYFAENTDTMSGSVNETVTTSLPIATSVSAVPTQTNSVTIVNTSSRNGTTASTSSENWLFVLTFPPTVSVSSGITYLNVSYTNTGSGSVSAYETVTLSSGTGTQPIGSPLQAVQSGGQMSLDLELGQLKPGDYSVTFYAVNNNSGAQLSQSDSITFKT